MGIEPTSEAWEASILPLYDARSAALNSTQNCDAGTSASLTRDVVFPTALADFKGSRRVDAPVARVESHHDFTQTDQVPSAVFLRLDRQPLAFTSTALPIRILNRCSPAPFWESEYESRQAPPGRQRLQ